MQHPRPSSRRGPVHRHGFAFASCIGLIVSSGCFTADLDPTASGVYACSSDDDCPGTMACSNAVCYATEGLPVLEVASPVPLEELDASEWSGTTRPLLVDLRGSLELRDPEQNEMHVVGEGHLVVDVDGEEALVITDGEFVESLLFTVQVPNRSGAHRLRVRAVRNDGVPYDHEGGTATQLFWIDDGQPHVAFVSPWPGTEIAREATFVTVQLAVLNFVPNEPAEGRAEGRGHAHIHYDDVFPDCVSIPECDGGHVAILGAALQGNVLLPAAPAGDASLTAILRHLDHSPYLVGTEDTPVVDTIEVRRGGSPSE